jgi:hypothetical protein
LIRSLLKNFASLRVKSDLSIATDNKTGITSDILLQPAGSGNLSGNKSSITVVAGSAANSLR